MIAISQRVSNCTEDYNATCIYFYYGMLVNGLVDVEPLAFEALHPPQTLQPTTMEDIALAEDSYDNDQHFSKIKLFKRTPDNPNNPKANDDSSDDQDQEINSEQNEQTEDSGMNSTSPTELNEYVKKFISIPGILNFINGLANGTSVANTPNYTVCYDSIEAGVFRINLTVDQF